MKLGFMVRDLGMSQLAYRLITGLNKWVSPQNDGWVFFEENQRPLLGCHFGVMNCEGAWGFQGALVATSFTTLKKALACPRATPYFYVWDLEWLRNRYLYSQLLPMYRSVPLLARSREHKVMIEKAWNVSVYEVGEDVTRIAETIQCLDHQTSTVPRSGRSSSTVNTF
jgi:hypothetical protein